mmetsp:Transcript_26473/g.47789  ORF Transcript_26473/g.47789 Transcript_26473/m.47789 type:complete len:309 (+) Transcript_26473:71-997(+)
MAMDKESAVRKSSHSFRLKEGILHQPTIAWPTVVLAIVSLWLWVAVAYLGVSWSLPLWLTFPLSTVAIYWAFTPMHDATHSSVAKPPYRWINESVGFACSVPFILVPHPLFRWLHLRHHKYTNDEDLDPDYARPHEGLMTLLLFPVDVVSTVWNWGSTVYKYGHCMDRAARRDTILMLSFEALIISIALHHGFVNLLLRYWILPMVSAVVFLGYVFDHVPHHPREAKASESVYACTGTVDGFVTVDSGKSWWLLTWITMGQNYHSIHHIFPTLPWYTYEKVWQGHREEFLKAGVPLTTLFGRDDKPKA